MSRRRKVGRMNVLMALAAAVVACALPCSAAGDWKIGALTARLDGKTGELELHGLEMQNEVEGISVVSQLARYDKSKRRVEFLEHVWVTQDGTAVDADSGIFDTETNAGSFVGSVSLRRLGTEEEAYEMELTCEELDLDTPADSFVAKRNAVLRYVDEDGEETILWADVIEYHGECRILKLTNVVRASLPGLPDDSQVIAQTMEFNTQTGDMDFTGLQVVLPPSDEAEAES